MSNKLSTFKSEETVNKLKNILNESKEVLLDESLLRRINDICRDMETELKKGNTENAKLYKNNELNKKLENYEERRQAGRRIHDNILDVIGVGLCLLDKNLKSVWGNKTLCDWLDLKDSPIGICCHDIYHCNDIGTGGCPTENIFKGGVGRIIETWVTTKDQKKMYVQHVAIPITNEYGDINNVLMITVDVTESEKFVHRLLLLQQLGEVMQGTLHLDKLLHLILTCVTSGYAFGFNRAMLFLINNEHNVLNGKLAVGPSSPEEANKIWHELSNKYSSLKEILKELDYSHNIDTPFNTMTKLMVFSLSDEREIVASCAKGNNPMIVKDAANDPRITDEFRKAIGANEFVCVPLIAKEQPKGVIVADNTYTGEQITEDKVSLLTMFANQAALAIENAETYSRLEDKVNQLTETQQKLAHSEKLAIIGSMASYVAHEIRNPLVVIGGFAKSLSRFAYTDQKIKTNIGIIFDEVRRLEKTLNNFTDISKPSIPEKTTVKICEIMENTCSLMQNYLQDKHINLHKKFDSDIPPILAASGQIKQVFLNLIMNAIDSMPDGGDLTVNIKSANKLMKIDIIDTGKGMSQEELQNIFDPFFTTKPQGTGVGLAVSLKIIKDHGGDINAKSECEKGTTISLSLPTN